MTDEHFDAWQQLAAAMDESLDGVRANYQDLVKIMDNTPLPTQLMADIAMATPALRNLIQSMLTPMTRQVAYVRRASRRKRLRYRSTVMRMEPIRFRAVREGWEARMNGWIDAPAHRASYSCGCTARTRKAASIPLYRWRRRMERYYAAKRPVFRGEE